MREKSSNLLWGLFFIVIGIGFAGNAFDIWHFELFFRGWWTLLIIVPCGISLIQKGFHTSNFIGLFIGIILLLSTRGILDVKVIGKLIVPLIFVIIGFSMILKSIFRGERGKYLEIEYQGGNTEHSAVFCGTSYQITGEKFMGTTINAIFGGVDLDLRNAIIDEDIVINATAVFGGIEIKVPPNVKVKVSNIPIFGGVDNKSIPSPDPDAPTILLNSTCMFGGIDIK